MLINSHLHGYVEVKGHRNYLKTTKTEVTRREVGGAVGKIDDEIKKCTCGGAWVA